MPEWVTYLLVFLAGIAVGSALRGRGRDAGVPGTPPPPLSGDLESQVRTLLADGRKIEAIKLYRDSTGAGLKEAKTSVESLSEAEGAVSGGPSPTR